MVYLQFSKTMNVSSLRPTGLVLLSHAGGVGQGATRAWRLTGGQVSLSNSVWVNISLLEVDINAIKALPPLASSSNTTHLAVDNGTAVDMRDNSLIGVASSAPMPVDGFVADATHAVLRAFTLDMDGSLLSLTFSKTVNPQSLTVAGIQLADSASSTPAAVVRLTAGNVSTMLGPVVNVTLVKDDLNAIKSAQPFSGASRNVTYLAMDAMTISDMSGNAAQGIPLASAMRVAAVQADVTAPFMTGFSLDMDSGNASLFFDEPVASSSVNLSGVFFTDSAVNGILIPCSPCVLRTPVGYSQIIAISLSTAVLNNLKMTDSIGSSSSSTYALLSSTSVADVASNPVTGMLAAMHISSGQLNRWAATQNRFF